MLNNGPKISIVISTWNRKKNLEETLSKIFQQNYKNFEVVVIDNCSNDGTKELMTEKFPTVKYIRTPHSNYGACETYNFGFENSDGEIIVLFDDDSFPENNNFLELIYKKFEINPNLGVICADVQNYFTKQSEIRWVDALAAKKVNHDEYIGAFLHGAGSAIKREALIKAGYFCEDFYIYANDTDLALQIAANGYDIIYWKKVKVYHKMEPSSYRVSSRRVYYFSRNVIWVFKRAYKFPLWFIYSLRWSMYSVFWSLKKRHLFSAIKGLLTGFILSPKWKKTRLTGSRRKLYNQVQRRLAPSLIDLMKNKKWLIPQSNKK